MDSIDTENSFNIRPAPNTCCPEMKYKRIEIDILSNGAMWEILECNGCGNLKRRFMKYRKDIEIMRDNNG